jgi:hypothetical protein
MNTTRTARATRARVAATVAALTGFTFVLTGCGGDGSSKTSGSGETSSADGTYLAAKDYDLGMLEIKGSAVTYKQKRCDSQGGGFDDGEADKGELDKDHTSIVWAGEGRFDGSTAISITDNSINVTGYDTFMRQGSASGKAVETDWQKHC